jgi:hypothetical protein
VSSSYPPATGVEGARAGAGAKRGGVRGPPTEPDEPDPDLSGLSGLFCCLRCRSCLCWASATCNGLGPPICLHQAHVSILVASPLWLPSVSTATFQLYGRLKYTELLELLSLLLLATCLLPSTAEYSLVPFFYYIPCSYQVQPKYVLWTCYSLPYKSCDNQMLLLRMMHFASSTQSL